MSVIYERKFMGLPNTMMNYKLPISLTYRKMNTKMVRFRILVV